MIGHKTAAGGCCMTSPSSSGVDLAGGKLRGLFTFLRSLINDKKWAAGEAGRAAKSALANYECLIRGFEDLK